MNTKKIIATFVLVIFILSSGILSLTSYAATGGSFVLNSKLYAAIKKDLQKQGITATYNDAQYTITISQEEMNKVTTLSLSNGEISDLKGLENFSNVTSLDLSSNEIDDNTDLTALNSLNLSSLDLSTNKLSDVSSVTGIGQIKTLNLHNQVVDTVAIVDNSVVKDGTTKVTIDMPQIVKQFGLPLKASWFTLEKNGDISVNFKTDGTVEMTIAQNGEQVDGLAAITLEISDTSNKLSGSKFNIFSVVIDGENERAIFIKDKNLYKAIKENLTKNQKINSDLFDYTGKWESITIDGMQYEHIPNSDQYRNLYEKAYDKQQIFVITLDDLVNKITSLKLDNRQIKDLSGIEYFVGLEKSLDVSSNYIDTIDRVLDLQAMKTEEESKLQTRFKEQIAYLKEELSAYEAAKASYDSIAKQIEELNKTIQTATETKNSSTEGSIVTAQQQIIDKAQEDLAKQQEALNKASAEMTKNQSKLESRLKKIYKMYNNVYQVTSPITPELRNITDDEFANLNIESAKALLQAQVTKIATVEKYFTDDDKAEITRKYGVEYTEDEKTPLSKYFTELLKTLEEGKQVSAYKSELNKLRYFDAYSRGSIYCWFDEFVNSVCEVGGCTYVLANSDEIQLKKVDGEKYNYLEENGHNSDDGSCYWIDNTNVVRVNNQYSGWRIDSDHIYANIVNIAGRLTSASDADISAWVVLPRLHSLDMEENLIEDIDKIAVMKELRSLNMAQNEIVDISKVAWSDITWLNTLDLSFNNISEIKSLENIKKLKYLYAAQNLISGSLDFTINDIDRLQKLDLSYNQIDDIESFKNQFEFIAANKGMTVDQYVTSVVVNKISLWYQELSMDVTIDKSADRVKVTLPPIFSQIEEIDYSNTSFGMNSFNGNVSADGKTVIITNPPVGSKTGYVYIKNANSDKNSIGYMTTCNITINRSSGESSDENSSGNNNNNNGQVQINVNTGSGSSVSGVQSLNNNSYIIVPKGTTVSAILKDVTLNTDAYNLVVKDANAQNTLNGSDKVTTNSTVLINGYNDNVQCRIVVKGDVTGDGDVNFSDVIKLNNAQLNSATLSDAEKIAGDVNSDSSISFADVIKLNDYYTGKINSL